MSIFQIMNRSERPSLLSDEAGSASTEWMVAVSIVVMMAVPVLGLVGDGTTASSNDIAVSIEDTDSMGGSGFHGDEGATGDAVLAGDDYVPGADMGVGFAPGEEEEGVIFAAGRTAGDAPRLFAGLSNTDRRDKPGVIRPDSGDEVVDTPRDRRPFAAPTPPMLVGQRLRMSDENCVEDIVAETPTEEETEQAPIRIVLASGR